MHNLKTRIQWAAALLLAALLLFLLSACGEQDPNAGVYLCTAVEVGEDLVPPSELYNGEVRLELRTGGSGRLLLGENEGDLRWSLEDGRLRVDLNGVSCPGELKDGVIRLDLLGEGVILSLIREELADTLPTPTPQPQILRDMTGDYYGWWEISDSTDDMPETWYDCCGSAVLNRDGLALTLWDERLSRQEPMAVLSLSGEGEELRVTDGWFWYDSVTEGAVEIRCADGVLELSGSHDAEGERFSYAIHLRPWGAAWEDPDARPYSYRFWYLPLIEAGEPMPESIIETEGK